MTYHFYEIPSFFYEDKIYDHIDNLVRCGAENYETLHIDDKEQIAINIIEAIGHEAYEMLLGDDVEDTLFALSKFLKTANKEDAYELLLKVRRNAITQYSYDIDNLIQEIKESQDHSRKREGGLIPYTDNQTGELLWRRAS